MSDESCLKGVGGQNGHVRMGLLGQKGQVEEEAASRGGGGGEEYFWAELSCRAIGK